MVNGGHSIHQPETALGCLIGSGLKIVYKPARCTFGGRSRMWPIHLP